MDASDIIRMRNANTQFSYLAKNVLGKKCYSDRSLDISGGCPLQFSSYAQKYLLKEGAKDLSGYAPPPPPTYNNKLGFYTLEVIDGYDTYQYRFYDGWGPLINSGISISYTIDFFYNSQGFQYALFYNGSNYRFQILDSTGFIINTIQYNADYSYYIPGPRYGILCYIDPTDTTNTFLLIDPQTNSVKTFISGKHFRGSFGVTGSAVSFLLDQGGIYYFYIWLFSSAQPYLALTATDYTIADTTAIMDHVAVASASGANGTDYDTVSVLLANGSLLSYTLPTSYSSIYIYYYGINNSRLSLFGNIGGSIDTYIFTLDENFKNPILLPASEYNPNGKSTSGGGYISLYQDSLTAQTNNITYMVLEDQPYEAPLYAVSTFTLFDGIREPFINTFPLACSNIGVNSNGVTIIAYDKGISTLNSYVLTAPSTITSTILNTREFDTSKLYSFFSANMNDYFYIDYHAPGSSPPSSYYCIDVATNTVAFGDGLPTGGSPFIVVSGNSLCRVSSEDDRLLYFNPSFQGFDTTTNVTNDNIYISYPDLASGCIFSINTDASFNILTSNTYNSNYSTPPLNVFDDDIGVYSVISDNFNIFASVDDTIRVFNINSNGVLYYSSNIPCTSFTNVYVQNTPSNIMWAFQNNNNDSASYINYNIPSSSFTNFTESNVISYTLRTNYYYTWYNK